MTNPAGFTGYGDDNPLRDITALDEGFYAVFLTNDPADGVTEFCNASADAQAGP